MKCIPFFFFLFIFSSSHAQNLLFYKEDAPHKEYCVTDHLHEQKIKSDNRYHLNTESINAYTLNTKSRSRLASQHYTIPVVVHIIHDNGSENISDLQVIKGIQDLNDAFRLIAPYNGINGADVGIEFCLAQQDPSGNFTTGINRVQSSLTNLEYSVNDMSLKNLSRWDPTQYLNIWLVKEICSGSSCGVAGYAYLAAAHGQPYDGVVNEARWFGSSTDNSKVHIHEVGHYLNLYHTFQGGCKNDNCLTEGDRVSDTPPDQSTAPVYPCNSIVNTCATDGDDLSVNNPFRPVANGGLGDQEDMFYNYMDYGYQSCQNVFSAGQKDRMVAALLGIRNTLLDSKGCSNPCTINISAGFTPSSASIVAGNSIAFTNTTTGASSYTWKVNGVIFSTGVNPSYLFNSNGSFTVTLIASNGDPLCTDSTSIDISVSCPTDAIFGSSAQTVPAGQSVNFTNTSIGAGQYEWRVNGVLFSNALNSAYTFNAEGEYIVELTALHSTLTCSDIYSDTIVVTCPVQAAFTSSVEVGSIGQSISFTNTSVSGVGYQWLVNGVFYSNATNISYSFPAAGNHSIGLIADNGFCDDTVYTTVRVVDPCAPVSKEANFWYFGVRAGIDFNSNTPLALTNGQINTREGVASISDKNGNLLFYTEGSSVWNKNHQIMTNGTGLFGDFSSTQSSIIVQNPANSNKYYIFTSDIGNGTRGYRYSEVDMTLNGNLGGVTIKNTLLHSNHTEKLAAVRHANLKDVWIITHEPYNNNYRAYLVTSTGVSTVPVISSVGSPITTMTGDWNGAGYLKFSPNGERLVHVFNGSLYRAEVLNFNSSTGVLTAPDIIIGSLSAAYGAEFSSDGNLLYLSELVRGATAGTGYNGMGAVSQYDLLAGSNAAINASRVELVKSTTIGYGAMQMGPDGRIYVSKENGYDVGVSYLGVVNSPGAIGLACDYQENGFYLSGRQTKIGLPNFISNYFGVPPIDFTYSQICNNTQVQFALNSVDSTSSWKWIFGDPASGSSDISYQRNPIHDFTAISSYQVSLIRISACGNNDTLQKNVTLQNNPVPSIALKDTALCSAGNYVLDAGNTGASYLWSTGETTQTISVNISGKYWVRVSYGACSTSDSVNVTFPGTSKEGNIWYFGYQAGLDFNSGSPVPLTNSQMTTYEGCATIADRNGSLLFYSDGLNIWNKNHSIMQNGADMGGDASSTQSAVIVPQPGVANIYYIFTVDDTYGTNDFFYSIIDMSLNNGLGAVTVKKVLIHGSSTERIAAVRHRNNLDVWIIHHELNNSNFGTYLLTSTGLNMAPVISNAGSIHGPGLGAIGALKASSDGKKLAVVTAQPAKAELFDFNDLTGGVSNQYSYPGLNTGNTSYAYGVEFSPDCSKLYISESAIPSRLIQLNILAGSPAAITSSATVIATNYTSQRNQAVQLGPDGKIYLTKRDHQYLSVINFPNSLGAACGYSDNSVFLGGKLSQYGLPNFIASIYTPLLKISGNDKICANQEVLYKVNYFPGRPTVWTISGDATIANSNDSTIAVKFGSSGSVKINAQSSVCFESAKDSLIVQIYTNPSPNLGKDTMYCSEQFPIILNAGSGYSSYRWQNASTASTFIVTTAGSYWVKVTNAAGCEGFDTIQIDNSGPRPIVGLGDQTICQGSIANFDAGAGFAEYVWSDGSNQQTMAAFVEGKYWVRVTNACSVASDTFNVFVNPLPLITFSGLDTVHCLGNGAIALTGNPLGGTFSGNGVTLDIFNPNIAGPGSHDITYSYTNSNGCSGRNVQRVMVIEDTTQINIKDLSVCNSEFPVTLDPGSFVEYLWQDGSTSATFVVSSPGEYSVLVKDLHGCVASDTIIVTVQLPFDIDMPDTSFCEGDSVVLNPGDGYDTYVWQDGSGMQKFTAFLPGEYYVEVSLSCEKAKDTVNVIKYPVPNLQITSLDNTYCVSQDIIVLQGNPSGGVFQGKGVSGNTFSLSAVDVGIHVLTYSFIDVNGCSNETSQSVEITEDCFFIPNLITPDNDGYNDYFRILGLGKGYDLEIYNRWNERVYKKDDYDNSFNGDNLSGGVYYYRLNNEIKSKEYKGWVHLYK